MDRFSRDSTETAALLDASGHGRPGAFDRLFERHRPYLRKVISIRLDTRLRGRLDASDLLQETQMEAVRRLPKYLRDRAVPVRLWLRQIAFQRLYDAHRRNLRSARRNVRREVPLPDRSAVQLGLMAAASSPSERAGRREVARLVREAIGQLNEVDREIVLMRSVEGLAYDAIAYVLQIDAATARQRHVRALVRLGKLLGEQGLRESQL